MINHKHKYIFVHMPRTGGSSIERALNPNIQLDNENDIRRKMGNTKLKDKHWTATAYQKNYPKNFTTYFKFSFIRNPWDREVSRWKWRQTAKNLSTFEDHLRTITTDQTFKQVKNKKGIPMVDFVGRYENLQKDFDLICDKINIPKTILPLTNKTSTRHYTEYYNNQTRKMIEEIYSIDIEYFGYKFGE